MPRTKVKLRYIADRTSRKTSFLKRKASVKKKLSELCTLCDVDACAIIYSQYDTKVEVWPSKLVAQYVLDRFMLVPEVEQSKKMVNQHGYIRKRIIKASEQLEKQMKENQKKRTDLLISECMNGEASLAYLTLEELKDVMLMIDHHVSELDERLEFLKIGPPPPPPPLPPPQPQPHLAQPQVDMPMGGSTMDNHMVVEGGVAADGYVPVVVAENPGSFDGTIPTAEWFPVDWVDGWGYGQADNLMTTNPFAVDPNPSCSGPSQS